MTNAELRHALGRYSRPVEIWQEPFDYNPWHYQPLCDARERWQPPRAIALDHLLGDYVLDLLYCEVQPDLFRYLLPWVLMEWREQLLGTPGGFWEDFWRLWLRRPVLLDQIIPDHQDLVEQYAREAILEAMAVPFVWTRSMSMPYRALVEVCSFALVFPVRPLWLTWWKLDTPGKAWAALAWTSRFLYEKHENPFETELKTYPPEPWMSISRAEEWPWRPENIAFLRAWLSVERLRDGVVRAAAALPGESVPARIAAELDQRLWLAELRSPQLLEILAENRFLRKWPL